MRAWKKAGERRRSARNWDAPGRAGERASEVRALFEAAREDAPAPDAALWEKLRPRLAAREARARQPLPFIAALAETGPGLAAAALGILLLAAGLYWSQGVGREAPAPALRRGPAARPGSPLNPFQMIGGGLEARTGQGLLRHVVYDAPEAPGARARR